MSWFAAWLPIAPSNGFLLAAHQHSQGAKAPTSLVPAKPVPAAAAIREGASDGSDGRVRRARGLPSMGSPAPHRETAASSTASICIAEGPLPEGFGSGNGLPPSGISLQHLAIGHLALAIGGIAAPGTQP
jgi:hypothetical protein